MNKKCSGLAGLIFGHAYEPVITKGGAEFHSVQGNMSPQLLEAIEKTRAQTFDGAVCKRCGAVIGIDAQGRFTWRGPQ